MCVCVCVTISLCVCVCESCTHPHLAPEESLFATLAYDLIGLTVTDTLKELNIPQDQVQQLLLQKHLLVLLPPPPLLLLLVLLLLPYYLNFIFWILMQKS